MSQIRRLSLLLLSIFLLSNCSSSSDSGSIFVTETGHPENWVNPAYISASDFHSSSVQVTSGTPEGAALYARECAGCHGENGSGDIGPNIQGRSAADIQFEIGDVIYMKWLSILTTSEIEAIASYLANPDSGDTPTANGVSADTCKECHGADFDGGIAKISCYSCHNGPDGTVGHPSGWAAQKNDSVHFHGTYGSSYSVACTACHGADLRGPIVHSCYSCHGSCDGGNCAPVANAGPAQSVVIGALVTLDGSGSSDVNGDPLTYNWSFTSRPDGSNAVLSNSTAVISTFIADIAGTYVVSLVVNDGKVNSEADSVTITASSTSVVSFSTSVQPIFNSNCITCHVSGGQASFMPLTSDVSYGNLVNQPSTRTGCPTPSGTRVIPFDSADSILYQRISGAGLPSCESTMPLGSALLSDTDQNLIKTWIDEGALNN